MSRSDVHPFHLFEPWQVWPGSYDNPACGDTFVMAPYCGPKISRTTRIASMGSCFAREIKSELLKEGFAYITEETGHPASKHASAAWERLYNTFSMRQIFEYTFGEFNPEVRWWIAPQSETVQDPVQKNNSV